MALWWITIGKHVCALFITLKWALFTISVRSDLAPTGHQWLMLVILPTWEAEIRRIAAHVQPGQIVHNTLFWKYPTQNRTRGMTQIMECLPSKCEALSSNPSNIKIFFTCHPKYKKIINICFNFQWDDTMCWH
jgi:hypothetical protein